MHLTTVSYYHATHEFQSESTLYSLPEHQGTTYLLKLQDLNLKFKSLSDCNKIRTYALISTVHI